jgi:acetylornithine deacetylase
MDVAIRTLLDWVDIPSVTGSEGEYGDALARKLVEIGLDVERQELAPGRFNVLARSSGRPRVVLCTHQDTVPQWFGPREDREFVHGRGSCDAKGPALAMIEAARDLLAAGEDRFGFLFTVGEETDSAGAALANAKLAEPWAPEHVIVGEPTDNRYVRAGKGTFKARLVARGEAGHSSQSVGPSAVHELVECAHRLLAVGWGTHPVLGAGSLNIGQIQGGVAANVVADRAEADLLIRTVEPVDVVRTRLESALGSHVVLAEGSKAYAPVDFCVPDGEHGITVAFGTDVPHMPRWGTPSLYGPGSILDAHTDHEKVPKAALDLARAEYARAVRWLLARADAAAR